MAPLRRILTLVVVVDGLHTDDTGILLRRKALRLVVLDFVKIRNAARKWRNERRASLGGDLSLSKTGLLANTQTTTHRVSASHLREREQQCHVDMIPGLLQLRRSLHTLPSGGDLELQTKASV